MGRRYSELRMLFYVGRDLARWIEQCMEFAERRQDALPGGNTYHSFATPLINDAPPAVQSKLRKWGVGDNKSIFFTRALGLQCLFADAPPRGILSSATTSAMPIRCFT